MLKGIIIGIIVILASVLVLSILAISGRMQGVYFAATVLPLMGLLIGFLVGFLVSAFRVLTVEAIKKVASFLGGALAGATVADVSDWIDAGIEFWNRQPSAPIVAYVLGSTGIFFLVGLITGTLLGLGIEAKSFRLLLKLMFRP